MIPGCSSVRELEKSCLDPKKNQSEIYHRLQLIPCLTIVSSKVTSSFCNARRRVVGKCNHGKMSTEYIECKYREYYSQ